MLQLLYCGLLLLVYIMFLLSTTRVHGGAVVTHSPPTSEVGGSNPEPYVRKLVVAYRWSAVYSAEA